MLLAVSLLLQFLGTMSTIIELLMRDYFQMSTQESADSMGMLISSKLSMIH